jgi:mannose-1-phosphate guanylyltransferase
MLENFIPILLAGGTGRRLWPESRSQHPKQFLSLYGNSTLIQQTVRRLAPLVDEKKFWALTQHKCLHHLIDQLPMIELSHIISEPVSRNTGPACILAALIVERVSPKSVIGTFSCDHFVGNSLKFLEAVNLERVS